MLVVTELFNNAVNDFDAKESARCSRVLFVTELVVSGTQCTCALFDGLRTNFLICQTELFKWILLPSDRHVILCHKLFLFDGAF